MKSSKRRIPLESARVGAQEDSQTDPPVMTLGMDMTSKEGSSKTLEKLAAGHVLQTCVCGWAKVTSTHGIKVHQGRKKCLTTTNPGPRIDRILSRRRLNQSDETQRQEETHSPQRISTPGNEEEASGRTTSPRQQPAYRKKESMQGRKPLVKWPKSNSKEWETINTDLSLILGNIKGSAEKKLEKMGDLIYSYGEEKCGVKEQVRKKDMLPAPKSRRLQEILQLVKERRRLRKLWRKATIEEREGINVLQKELKHRLSKLRRAESLRMRWKKKEKARTDFYKDPFKFVKGIFTKEKSGFLKTSKDQVEEHLRTIYTDEKKDEPIVVPTDIPPVSPPQHQFDISPPKLSEVKQAVKKARSASAPGPNGVPYSVYKKTPDVLKILWKNMKVVWDKQIIPKAWRRAGGVFIPKEKNSTTIEQFRQINLLNIEGKIFFSVLAQRLTQYLKQNHFIDTSIQKAGIAGFSGCLEHNSIIWHQIQTAKKERKELHVLFLDLANAYGSVPHSFLWAAFDFFQVPTIITNLVKHYFQDLQFCLTTSGFTTSWQPLEVGIMAGCTISPLAFTMAMEIIIRASKWVVGGERLQCNQRLPPIRAYMDDLTTLTTTVPCTKRLLEKLHQNITWARMKLKPSKCRSISIVKGQVTDQRFHVGGTPVPTVSEMPVKSLGRWYDAKLKDTEQFEHLKNDTSMYMERINKTLLPGKLKLWCFQFGILPKLLWPLTVYEIPITKVEKLERLISIQLKQWLGIPRCLSSVGLYGHGKLELPITGLVEEFKCTKVRLVMTLTESEDAVIRTAAPRVVAGRKWTPSEAVQSAKSALHFRDVVGQVQHGRAGFGLIPKTPLWHKATSLQKRQLVVEEVRRQEEGERHAKAVSMAKQGRWTNWEGLEKKKLSWRDIWQMEGARLSFVIRATYDLLPSPQNLKEWYGEDPACSLCQVPASLRHILSGCTTSLTQGRYTWRHNQVLRELALILEQKRTTTNNLPQMLAGQVNFTNFVPAGHHQEQRRTSKDASILQSARDWKLEVDLDKKLVFPPEIVITTLRPDMVLWSPTTKLAYVVELTVPWEEGVEEAYERKNNKYSDLAAEASQNGWKTNIFPVEVGCRGFVATSTTSLLRKIGVKGRSLQQAIKSISSAAEKSSNWLWIKRKDSIWAAR